MSDTTEDLAGTADTPFGTPAGEIKRDQWGRYLLPDPNTGKTGRGWVRATTFAKTVADDYDLSQWMMRMVAKGIAMRPDLHALAVSADVTDKATLQRVAESAKEHAGGSSGANLGTALHGLAQRVDEGTLEVDEIPEPYRSDIQAYRDTMDAHGIQIVSGAIERIVVVPELHVAGTFDRLATVPHSRLPVVADLKTGKDLSWAALEISVQQAIYARATHMWLPGQKRYLPMPEVNQEVALIIHLPVGSKTCTLYWVDIARGWAIARICREVREIRSASKTLLKSFSAAEDERAHLEELARSLPPITREQLPPELLTDDGKVARPHGAEADAAIAAVRAELQAEAEARLEVIAAAAAVAELKAEIDTCLTSEQLSGVWARNVSLWTPELTAYGRAHQAKLGIS